MSDELEFSAALSTNPDTYAALTDVCQRAREDLGASADLAVLFLIAGSLVLYLAFTLRSETKTEVEG